MLAISGFIYQSCSNYDIDQRKKLVVKDVYAEERSSLCIPNTPPNCGEEMVINNRLLNVGSNGCQVFYSYKYKVCSGDRGIYIYDVSWQWPMPTPKACTELKLLWDRNLALGNYAEQLKLYNSILAAGSFNIEKELLKTLNPSNYLCNGSGTFSIQYFTPSCLRYCEFKEGDIRPEPCGTGCCKRITNFCYNTSTQSYNVSYQYAPLEVCNNPVQCSSTNNNCTSSCDGIYPNKLTGVIQ